jgi:predicted Zn-dependent protease
VSDPLRAAIEEAFVVERDGWAAERVGRVSEQLQRDAVDRFETIVIWIDEHTAFTAPGTTVYFSRRLLERLPDDDAAAFVIAHEIAHHRLGHVPQIPKRFIARLPIRIVLALLDRWIAGPQHETDADLVAIEMCIDAGYDVERCLHALEQLSIISLDYRDVDGVLGHEDGRRRSHPPTTARLAAARAHARRVQQQGFRIGIDVEARRRERRRRIAITAGAAAAAVALLLIRRR